MKTNTVKTLTIAATGLGLAVCWMLPSLKSTARTATTALHADRGASTVRKVTRAATVRRIGAASAERQLDNMFGFGEEELSPTPALTKPQLQPHIAPLNIVPVQSPRDPLADYVYSGAVTVAGKTVALIENRFTKQGWYLGAGDVWEGNRIESVDRAALTLDINGVRREMRQSDSINVVQLSASAPTSAPAINAVDPGQGVPNNGVSTPGNAAQLQSGAQGHGNGGQDPAAGARRRGQSRRGSGQNIPAGNIQNGQAPDGPQSGRPSDFGAGSPSVRPTGRPF